MLLELLFNTYNFLSAGKRKKNISGRAITHRENICIMRHGTEDKHGEIQLSLQHQ